MDVTVVVPSYGEPRWADLALGRAVPSAEALGVPVLHHHGFTLHGTRNVLLDQVETEFVCHLDADDELEPGFFAAIAASSADVRAPSVRYVRHASDRRVSAMPRVAGHRHACVADCLADGNWLVVGAVARADLLREVGGWRDYPWSEDWDLWVRCWRAGATIEAAPKAVYRAHVRADSRNRAPAREAKLAAHRAIARDNGLQVPA